MITNEHFSVYYNGHNQHDILEVLCCLILYPNTTSVPVILYSSKQVIQ